MGSSERATLAVLIALDYIHEWVTASTFYVAAIFEGAHVWLEYGMAPTFQDPLVSRIAAFLLSIGLPVRAAAISEPTFLPGMMIVNGELVVDESRLSYPGDLLHEAGHLAVTAPELRGSLCGNVAGADQNDGGNEIAAMAWSFAAAVHLGIDPSIVFHPHGYRGSSEVLLTAFREGRTVGFPLLQWYGLTADAKNAVQMGVPPFPHMTRWIR